MTERLPFDAFCTNFQTLFGNLILRTSDESCLGFPPLLSSLIILNYFCSVCVKNQLLIVLIFSVKNAISILIEFIRYSINQITKLFAIGCLGGCLGISIIFIAISIFVYMIMTGKIDPIILILKFFSNQSL